ncbi:unnamed protein product [Urochloa humidicola]
MAPTSEQEGGEEGWGSRLRRRRGFPTPPAVTTQSRATQSAPPPSQPGKRKRSTASRGRGRKGGRSTGREHEKDAEEAAAAAAAASPPAEHASSGAGREHEKDAVEEAAAAASPPAGHASSGAGRKHEKDAVEESSAAASPPAGHASSGACSEVSSPLRWPSIPRTVIGENAFGEKIFEPFHKIDPAIIRTHDKLQQKCLAKQERQLKLVTLDLHIPRSCMVSPSLLRVRESAEQSIRCVAKSVLGLSSYVDGKLLARSSGFLIDWDANKKIGKILTSALVIQSKSPSIDEWLATDEYAPHAEVRVHLMDKTDTTVVADLLHYDKHYNLALFKISTNLSAQIQIPSFTMEQFAEEVFVLGRDEKQNLTIDHGNVLYQGPGIFRRHHYMFISCNINELGIGGPVINLGGQVTGMFSLREMAFTPSIILKCLQMWKSFNCIPRLHVGMKLSAIGLLDLPQKEKVSCKCGVDGGLIVKKVSEGSVAEKLGVRRGDIIKSWNGENISTTIELENFLLDTCKKHLDGGNSIGSSVDLSIGIFHVRDDSHGTIKMTVNVSDDVEVITEGIYPVTDADCVMADDDNGDCLVIQDDEEW